MNRIEKEKQIVDWMIDIWERKQHSECAASFCDKEQPGQVRGIVEGSANDQGQAREIDTNTLREYAHKRLDNCRFGESKPTCDSCPIHCYNREMRERIRTVMRFSGPRMILYHPWAAVWHLLKKFSKKDTHSGSATR